MHDLFGCTKADAHLLCADSRTYPNAIISERLYAVGTQVELLVVLSCCLYEGAECLEVYLQPAFFTPWLASIHGKVAVPQKRGTQHDALEAV
jgi:hypothetical protein